MSLRLFLKKKKKTKLVQSVYLRMTIKKTLQKCYDKYKMLYKDSRVEE